MSITLEKRTIDYVAFINGDRRLWASGISPYEAIGNVISTHGSDFGIAVDYAGIRQAEGK